MTGLERSRPRASASRAQRRVAPNDTGESASTSGPGSFAKQAMLANKAEVKLGELAGQQAQSADVKAVRADDGERPYERLEQLKQAVKGHGVDEPAKLDTKHQALRPLPSWNGPSSIEHEGDGRRSPRGRAWSTRADATAHGRDERPGSDDSRLDNAVNQWATKALPTVTNILSRRSRSARR